MHTKKTKMKRVDEGRQEEGDGRGEREPIRTSTGIVVGSAPHKGINNIRRRRKKIQDKGVCSAVQESEKRRRQNDLRKRKQKKRVRGGRPPLLIVFFNQTKQQKSHPHIYIASLSYLMQRARAKKGGGVWALCAPTHRQKEKKNAPESKRTHQKPEGQEEREGQSRNKKVLRASKTGG